MTIALFGVFVKVKRNDAPRRTDGFVGISGYTSKEIALMYAAGEKTAVRGCGVLHIAAACDRAQLYSVIEGIEVRGWVIAPQDVKAHYGLK